MASYTIKSGDSLSKIAQQYGVSWQDIWKANPNIKDPNKIYPNATITIPEKQATPPAGSSLEKTLPSAGVNEATGKTLPSGEQEAPTEIPTTSLDQMTLLKMALGEASSLAVKSGLRTGLETTFGSLGATGYSPEKQSGSMVGKIIDFVEGQVAPPVEKEFNKMTSIIDSITSQKASIESQREKLTDNARQQITQAISSDMWNNMTDDQRKKLWDAAGYTGDPVSSKSTNTAAYHVTDDNGDVWNVIYDKSTGAIINKENLGSIGKGKSGSGTTDEDKEIKAFQNDAADLIEKLDSGNGVEWKTAWDKLKLKYPSASNESIDAALGGGYNPTTKEWWGRAKTQ